MKPYNKYFSIKFRLFRESQEYKNGIRKLSIEWDKNPKSVISDDFKWIAPIIQWKIYIGAILISGMFPCGKVSEYKQF